MIKQILLSLIALYSFPVLVVAQPEWQSQYAIGKNKLAPHTYIWPYANADAVGEGNYEQSPYYMSLNGKWKFHWVKNPDHRPKEFYKPSFIRRMGRYRCTRQLGTSGIWYGYLCE